MSQRLETSTIDRLFLELSQFTTATTEKESDLRRKLDIRWHFLEEVARILDAALVEIQDGRPIKRGDRLANQLTYLRDRAVTLSDGKEPL